jgi:hypothetical protein
VATSGGTAVIERLSRERCDISPSTKAQRRVHPAGNLLSRGDGFFERPVLAIARRVRHPSVATDTITTTTAGGCNGMNCARCCNAPFRFTRYLESGVALKKNFGSVFSIMLISAILNGCASYPSSALLPQSPGSGVSSPVAPDASYLPMSQCGPLQYKNGIYAPSFCAPPSVGGCRINCGAPVGAGGACAQAVSCAGSSGSIGAPKPSHYHCHANGWGCDPSPRCQADYAKDVQMAPTVAAAELVIGGFSATAVGIILTMPAVITWASAALGISATALGNAAGVSALLGLLTSYSQGMSPQTATGIMRQWASQQAKESADGCLADPFQVPQPGLSTPHPQG